MERKLSIVGRPFVKWVGGKSQLLNEIRHSLPSGFSEMKDVTYVEPFVGGGAVLFWILQEYPNITRAVINDVNEKLICTYLVIKNDVDELIRILERIQSEYYNCDITQRKEYFLNKRTLFNTKDVSDIETAALFIFLNRTCFNGLYRVNSKGDFNVPHGKYANPRICDKVNLLAVSKILQKVEILCGDFAQTKKYASDNTIFYFDPPYKPLSETSSFTSYSKEGFDDSEQIRLRDFCDYISQQNAFFIASNSDPVTIDSKETFFDKIYNHFYIKRVSAVRLINSDPNGRGKLSEIIISNNINI